MRIVKLTPTPLQRKELEQLQTNGSSLMRERSLAILHCADGQKITWIANALNRTHLTIRTWIAAFREKGVPGLERAYSPGRPSIRTVQLKPKVQEYLQTTPRTYGWADPQWTVAVINAQLEKDFGKCFGESTLSRLMHDLGYSFKRVKKKPPVTAPTKEEKLAAVQKIARDVLALKATGKDVEVVFLDEAHFSNVPYIARGWHKRGVPFFPADARQAGRAFPFWGLRAGKKVFLLEVFPAK